MTTLRVGGDGLTTSADRDWEPYERLKLRVCAEHGPYSFAVTTCPKCEQRHRDARGREAAQRIREGLRESAAQRKAQYDGGVASAERRRVRVAQNQRARMIRAQQALARNVARGVASPAWKARMSERQGVIEAELARVERIIAGAL